MSRWISGPRLARERVLPEPTGVPRHGRGLQDTVVLVDPPVRTIAEQQPEERVNGQRGNWHNFRASLLPFENLVGPLCQDDCAQEADARRESHSQDEGEVEDEEESGICHERRPLQPRAKACSVHPTFNNNGRNVPVFVAECAF